MTSKKKLTRTLLPSAPDTPGVVVLYGDGHATRVDACINIRGYLDVLLKFGMFPATQAAWEEHPGKAERNRVEAELIASLQPTHNLENP